MGERGAMPKYEYEQMFGPDKATYGPQGNQIVYETTGLGAIVTIANGLFAVIIVAALWRGDTGVVAAIVTGGLYYGVTTMFALLVLSGSLAQIVVNRQEQVTLRQYHVLLAERPQLPGADPLHIPGTPAADRLPGPLGGVTYVAAEDMTIRRDAALWAVSLYGGDGQADPAKVNLKGGTEPAGRLKVAAPGSAAKEYLIAKRVLQKIDHGYRLNIARYPTADTLRDILG